MMRNVNSAIITLAAVIFLSSCGAKVNICNQEFSQNQELPLKYSEINKAFLSALKDHRNADRNDINYVNKLYSGENTHIYKLAAYWSHAGLESNGDQVFVKDTKLIQELQESVRWQKFEQRTGLCKLMR